MKVLTVRQPWASLIVAGIKTIETRPAPPNGPMRPDGVAGLPGLPIEPGERIGIHAAAARPAVGMVGEWLVRARWGEFSIQRHMPGESSYKTIWLPLGALIGTVEVREVFPIVDEERGWALDAATRKFTSTEIARLFGLPPHLLGDVEKSTSWGNAAVIVGHGADELFEIRHGAEWRISDQLPLGDFTPGRWAWILAEPEPCDPQPMPGRQGVWRWDP